MDLILHHSYNWCKFESKVLRVHQFFVRSICVYIYSLFRRFARINLNSSFRPFACIYKQIPCPCDLRVHTNSLFGKNSSFYHCPQIFCFSTHTYINLHKHLPFYHRPKIFCFSTHTYIKPYNSIIFIIYIAASNKNYYLILKIIIQHSVFCHEL